MNKLFKHVQTLLRNIRIKLKISKGTKVNRTFKNYKKNKMYFQYNLIMSSKQEIKVKSVNQILSMITSIL